LIFDSEPVDRFKVTLGMLGSAFQELASTDRLANSPCSTWQGAINKSSPAPPPIYHEPAVAICLPRALRATYLFSDERIAELWVSFESLDEPSP
jgi:hypothetical protein